MLNSIPMSIKKVIPLIMLAVFLFSSAGFCDVVSPSDDDGQHCSACCGAPCCSMILSSQLSVIVPSTSQKFSPIAATLRQELFVSGIEYPPKSLI